MRSPTVFLYLGVLCLFSAAALGYYSLPSPPEYFGPVNPELDLGRVEQKQEIQVAFNLENHCREVVTISKVDTSCGCTDATVSRNVLPPGETATLTATWRTGALRGQSSVSLAVAYLSADQRHQILPLTIKGYVVPDILVEPTELTFERGTAAIRTVRLTPGRLDRFQIERAYASHRAISVALLGTEGSLSVQFDPTKTPNNSEEVSGFVAVVTDSPREPVIYIGVKVDPPNVPIGAQQ